MRYLFIGLFCIAFLAGVVTMGYRPAEGRPGIVNGMLSAMGFAQRENNNRTQGNYLIKKSDGQMERAQEMMRDLAQTQKGLMEDVSDQQRFLEDSSTHIENLSVIVKEFADRNNSDWLRLKETMNDFNSQSRILIENGKLLIDQNKEQLKIRQQSYDDATITSIKSNINENRFQQYVFESLKQRNDFINKSATTVQSIREQTERLQDKLKSLENNLTKKEDAQLLTHLKDMKEKSQGLLADIKIKESRLRDLNQQHQGEARAALEKTTDFINQTSQHLNDTQESMRERQRQSDERVRDQIERLKEQRSH